jgi:yecA family protein
LRNAKPAAPACQRASFSAPCVLYYHSTMLSDIRFKDFEDVLATAGSLADAAEAHGSLCGALCSMSPYKMQDWLNEILPDSNSLSEESSAMIERVFTATATTFGEQGMEFEPLLPDDESPLNGRANALALWCTGFLYGLGTGAISDLEGLKGDVGEIVRDFTEISRATGDDADSDESNEQAYAELVEFIRVAAQVVFEELLPLRRQVYPAQQRLH